MTLPAAVGHNGPPSYLELVPEVARSLAAFLAETPVIEDEQTARAAGAALKRGRAARADLEDERDAHVRPLNDRVREINAAYRAVYAPLDAAIATLADRLGAWMAAEERRREAEAAERARAAAEAIERARAAEEAARDIADSAALGEIGLDIIGAGLSAAEAEAEAARLEREAARAERDSHVRLGVGYGKAVALREVEVLTIENWHAAIAEMGLSDRLRSALLTDARAYRKVYGRLPAGVIATTEKRL